MVVSFFSMAAVFSMPHTVGEPTLSGSVLGRGLFETLLTEDRTEEKRINPIIGDLQNNGHKNLLLQSVINVSSLSCLSIFHDFSETTGIIPKKHKVSSDRALK